MHLHPMLIMSTKFQFNPQMDDGSSSFAPQTSAHRPNNHHMTPINIPRQTLYDGSGGWVKYPHK